MILMAFFDNPRFLLSHIRHSFITCDDTGMCEMVMLNESVPPLSSLYTLDSEDEDQKKKVITGVLDLWDTTADAEIFEPGESYDVVSGMELIGTHRPRSNTAQRLERLKKEKRSNAKIKNITWSEAASQLSEKERLELFPKREVVQTSGKVQVSALAEQLRTLPAAPDNPFNEYARFDGKMTQGEPVKHMHIFLPDLPEEERAYPMEVVTVSHAKVQDLVGLICWQYTKDGLQPKLKPDINAYCLRIAEETGEVDEDFPNLETNEPVSKFDFPVLALVKREMESGPLFTLHIEEGFSKMQVSDPGMTVRDMVDQALKRRKTRVGPYHVEKASQPSTVVKMDTALMETGTHEFNLVFDERSGSEGESEDLDREAMTVMEAPLYQSYSINMLHKLGRSSQIQLGVSGEKVEINPVSQKGASKLLGKQAKPATHRIENIACCDLVTKKYNVPSDKAVFRLLYRRDGEEEVRTHIFEGEKRCVHEIVQKMKSILEMRSSQLWNDYKNRVREKLLKRPQ